MNVRNTLLFLAVSGIVIGLTGGIGIAKAAGPPAGGSSVGHGGPPGGGHHSGGGGHNGNNRGHHNEKASTTSVVNNNGDISSAGGRSTVVYPTVAITPQQGTPYPCPTGYFPVGAPGLPFGYHTCKLSPETIRKAEEEAKPVSSWDVDYKAEAARTKAQIEYLKARRELLNELGEDE